MQVKIEFVPVNKMRKCVVPTGTLYVTRVPGMGLQGYHKPNEGRSQVFVPTGRFKTFGETQDALYSEWRRYVGLDEIRSF